MQMYRRVMTAVVATAMVLAAAPAFAQGQTQVNTGLGIGALGGINWTSVQTDANEFDIDFQSSTGWQLGIWFGGNRDGRVGLMGELSYAVKKYNASQPDFGFDLDVEQTYVQIPVLLRINAGSRQREKPSLYFLAGPVFDIQIKTKENGESVDDDDESYEALDIGIMIGAGFEVARIGIEGRYSFGMKSVLKTDAALDNGLGDGPKLNTFSLVAKIRFN
jgi:hypothetical protein